MIWLRFKKYWYLILKLFIKSKITFYQVLIKDIDQKLDELKTLKTHNKNSKKEGK